jgi:hydrophobic/amphiphilic exporter-1 (mainly G- bacteria), HAE1 family
MLGSIIHRPVAVAMACIAVALLGVAAWRNVPIELLPDTSLPRLTIQAQWAGASPEVTEALVTSPIEAAVQQVRGVEKVTSESSEQNGVATTSVEVRFARETEMDFARLELSERLAALEDELPPGASRPVITPYVPEAFREQTRPFLAYTVTGPYTLEALRAYVDEGLAPELRQVEGVGVVQGEGGRARLLEVELQAERIAALGLTPEDVTRRVGEMEIVREAGRVEVYGRLHTLALRERTESPDEIRNLPLLWDAGRVVRLGDVASVRDGFEEALSHYRIDAQPAVAFTVYRESGSNAVAVADRVKERLAVLGAEHPSGVRLLLDSDESEAIRAQLTDLRTRALIAAGVIFLVLILFLRSWRSAGIVFTTIAFSILLTVNLIYWTGHSLNVLTLMGLALGFGLIVDNAIVVLENVYRHRRGGAAADRAAEVGAREVVLPVLAATCTTLVVMIPFVYLQGELRIFYVPLALVVGFSLLASLAVAFTFTPALAARALRAGAGGAPSDSSARQPLHLRVFGRLTGWTLRWPIITVTIAMAMLGGAGYLFEKNVTRGVVWGRAGGDDTYIAINISLPRGEELTRTDALVRDFEARLREIPEIARFVTRVSSQRATIRATFPDSLNHTYVPVAIKEQMVAFSHGFGGADVRVYGFGPSFYGGGGSPPSYSIQVLGYEFERVREIAEDLGRRLERFSRIQEVDTNASGSWFQTDRATELVLDLDRERLASHGLTAVGVAQRVRAAVAGSEGRGSLVRLGGEEVRFSVKLAGHHTLDDLSLTQLLIPASGGAGVRLGDVATLREREVQASILREDQQYQRRIVYEFRGPARLGDRVRDVVVEATDLPPGYSLVTTRDWSWSRQEQEQIYGVLIVSLFLIFMVTAALFESIRLPFVVLLTVPMALIGVFLLFYQTGASFTREAYIGVIMMGGIVVNNAILLVHHISALRREAGVPLHKAVLQGTLDRVRPILMTSVTTVLGLLPLVLFSDHADSNIWNALAYALIGGLTSSTLLVLTVTPALYLLVERRTENRRRSDEERWPGKASS